MKKITKIFLSFVLILSLILQIIPKSILAESDITDDTTKITLAVFTENKNEDGTAKYDYYTGEDVSGFAEVSISGNKTVLKNPKTVLTIPKKNIWLQPVYPKSEAATSSKLTEDDENWYVTFNFDKLIGGQSIAIPFIFEWKQPMTPNGFKTPVTYELFNSAQESLGKASIDFIAKTYPLDSLIRVNGLYKSGEEQRGEIINEKEIDGNKVKVALIDNLNSDELVNTKSGKDAPCASFEIGVTSQDYSYGRFGPSQVKIIDKLPAGAVMQGTPDEDGYYHYRYSTFDREYKWKYNAEDHSATYVGDLESIQRITTIKLQFPNQPYETVHKNTAIIILNPDTDEEQTLPEKSEYLKWDPEKRKPTGQYDFFNEHEKENYAFIPETSPLSEIPQFKLIVTNTHNDIAGENDHFASLSLTEIVDFNLDERLYYKSIRLDETVSDELANKLLQTGYKVFGVKEDNTEVLLGENMPKDTKLEINDTEDKYQKLIIRMNQPLEISKTQLKFVMETPVKDSIWEKWKLNPESEDLTKPFGQDAELSYYETSDATQTIKKYKKESQRSHYTKERRELSSSNDNNYTVIYGDDKELVMGASIKIGGELGAITEKNPASNYKIAGLKHISLLPTGIEYVPESGVARNGRYLVRNDGPQIVSNFKNTGKTAVIFDLSDITRDIDYDGIDASVVFRIKPNIFAKEGDNIIDHYLVWDNPDKVEAAEHGAGDGESKNKYIDVLDLNNNGNTTEKLLHGTNTIHFVTPRELLFRKYVSLDKKDWVLDAAFQASDTNVFYKLNLFNNTQKPIKTVHILDVLPYQGDHSIVPNKNGEYLPRESMFAVKLNAFLEDIAENAEILQKWKVLYSTDVQPDTLDQTKDANFVSKESISNIEDVKMIKIMLKENEELAANSEANFIVSGKLPNSQPPLNTNYFAKNSAAISTNTLDYIEGNKVSVSAWRVKYTILGTVFSDLNKNTLFEDGEGILPSYELQLMHADGTPALDERKQPIVTISDDQGYYRFNVYENGEYYIKITKKRSEEFASINTEKLPNGNTAMQDPNNPQEGKTEVFTLDPSKTTITENIGFINLKGILEILKVNENLTPLENVEFALYKYEDGVEVARATTDAKGKIIFDNIEFDNYTLKETKTLPEYELDPTEYPVWFDSDYPVRSASIPNKYKRGTIIFEKKDSTTNKPLSGVTLELKEGNTVIQTGTSDENGIVRFEDVKYGNYTIVEKETLPGHVLDNTEHSVNLNQPEVVVNSDHKGEKRAVVIQTVGNVVDVLGGSKKQIPLQNVTFVLKKDGVVQYHGETLEDGSVKIDGVIPGTYELEESSITEGFVKKEGVIQTITIEKSDEPLNLDIIEHEQIKGSIKVINTDAEDSSKLEGVTFELRKDGKKVQEKTTNADGELLFTDIPYGTYQIVETQIKDGYILNKEPQEIVISENGTVITKEITNTKIKGKVKVLISDKSDGKALEGVKFELRKDGTKVQEGITNENGELLFTDVPYGTCQVVETQAKEGYVLNKEPEEVVIHTNGEVIEKVITSTKQPNSEISKKEEQKPTENTSKEQTKVENPQQNADTPNEKQKLEDAKTDTMETGKQSNSNENSKLKETVDTSDNNSFMMLVFLFLSGTIILYIRRKH